MLPAIENGFTFIAFLMFLAGGLLAMEKYTKWKVFNWVPWACTIPKASVPLTAY